MHRLSLSRRIRAARRSRAGVALYSIVVFNALLIGLLSLSALAVARIERRQNLGSSDQLIARENAVSAVSVALARIKADSAWRTTFLHNVESASIAFASGTATWRLVDMVDTTLNDNPRDGVLVQGIGRCGAATWVESVEALQPEVPLPSLATAIHSKGRLRIDSGRMLTVVGGLVSTDGSLEVNGALTGNGECSTRNGSGSVTGSVTTGITAREAPVSSTLFTTYKNLATTLSYNGDIGNDLLGPGVNTYGGSSNADGIYYINSGSSTLTISDSRLLGTLVVKGNVRIEDNAFLQLNRQDAPVLIVDGNVTLQCDSSLFLSEDAENQNFNSATAPFQGVTDADEADVYPSEIWGLVHVLGNLTVTAPARVVGMVLVDGEIRISEDATFQSDPTIFFAPPSGYWTATPGPLQLKPSMWRRATAP